MTVAELYKTGMDHNKIAVEIYQRKRLEKVKLFNAILSTMELIRRGKANLAVMTQQMLTETGAFPTETEGLVEELRNIDGVEISAFLREEEGRVRVTMRAKTEADVSKIAMRFGGGGHTKAAGCTIPGSIDEVKPLIIDAISEQLDSLEG
jgi:phosphoesterase RecJ-like protein